VLQQAFSHVNKVYTDIYENKKHSCRKETVRWLRGSVMATWNWETIFCEHYSSIFNHCDLLQSYRIRWNNAK